MIAYTHICVICGKRVKSSRKRQPTRYTPDGEVITMPFICEDCLDGIDESMEPDETYEPVDMYTPTELYASLLV